ncbi:MAG: NUDIX hydrolase [Caulobacteraceae bacterium]
MSRSKARPKPARLQRKRTPAKDRKKAQPALQPRLQYAVIPWRLWLGTPQVLIISSRETGRWVIPKGWPMPGKTPWDAAATEAYEESGARGEVSPEPCGRFTYGKRLKDGAVVPLKVEVFAMRVREVLEDWPEKHQRRRMWVSPKIAAERVDEPELAELLRTPNLYAPHRGAWLRPLHRLIRARGE